jgi:uncharacterized integral membrane protein
MSCRDSPFAGNNNFGGGFGKYAPLRSNAKCAVPMHATWHCQLVMMVLLLLLLLAVGDRDKIRLHTVEFESAESSGEAAVQIGGADDAVVAVNVNQ